MTPEQIAQQNEMDDEVLNYVRALQGSAPIRQESVYRFLTKIRRREITEARVRDRLNYLVSKGWLAGKKDWMPGEGEVIFYTVTADGCDVLDGVKPKG